jgi:hypothetical protein
MTNVFFLLFFFHGFAIGANIVLLKFTEHLPKEKKEGMKKLLKGTLAFLLLSLAIIILLI